MSMLGKESTLPSGVRPLTGSDNWPRWKAIIRQYFKASGLWGLIEETETEPNPPTPLQAGANQQARDAFEHGNKKIADWHLRNEKVIDILYRTVDETQSYIIMKDELTTPKQLWGTLLKNFDQDTSSNKRQLLKRLMALKQGELSINKFFAEISDVQNRLASLKVTVDPDMLVNVALEGLAPQYEMIRTSLDAKDELTLDQIQVAVRNAENRQGEEQQSSTELAMRINSNGPRYSINNSHRPTSSFRWNSGEEKLKFTCHHCGEIGHYAKFCPKGCYNCGGARHFANDCPSPPDPNRKRPKSPVDQVRSVVWGDMGGTPHSNVELLSEEETEEDCECSQRMLQTEAPNESESRGVMSASTKGLNGLKTSFLIDSGATAHMVNNSNLLSNIKPLKTPAIITFGNGTVCNAVAKGTMTLICDVNGKRSELSVPNTLVVPDLHTNLLSVASARKTGNSFQFGGQDIVIRNEKDSVIAKGFWDNDTPFLSCQVVKPYVKPYRPSFNNRSAIYHRSCQAVVLPKNPFIKRGRHPSEDFCIPVTKFNVPWMWGDNGK
jgi:hypothetical protein